MKDYHIISHYYPKSSFISEPLISDKKKTLQAATKSLISKAKRLKVQKIYKIVAYENFVKVDNFEVVKMIKTEGMDVVVSWCS